MNSARRRWLPIALIVAALLVAQARPAAADESLPPLDHAAVLAAVQNATSGGLPSYLIHGIDELGDWSAAVGTADLKTGAPADPEAAFRIGSISKMFVSVAILQLVNEGKVGLDTPVSSYLPGLLKRGDAITIRMLLQHRAGLGSTQYRDYSGPGKGYTWFAGLQQGCNRAYDQVAVIKAADNQLFEPGTSFNYANAGYATLGMVIEKVTGQPYEQVLRDRIVLPLGLDDTSFQEGAPVWPGSYLHGYVNYKPGTGNATQGHLADQTTCKTSIYGAAGSGISTTRDLATFMRALTHGALLPPALYAQMIDGQDTDGFFPPSITYGLGIIVQGTPCGVTLIGHTGGVLGYQTSLSSTLDGTRTLADVVPIYPGTDAMLTPLGAIFFHEFCGGY